ncbi:Chitin synthase, class 2 [Tilletia horrida]|nr:Chitin synthase, class 2 [Tilletia horrida]
MSDYFGQQQGGNGGGGANFGQPFHRPNYQQQYQQEPQHQQQDYFASTDQNQYQHQQQQYQQQAAYNPQAGSHGAAPSSTQRTTPPGFSDSQSSHTYTNQHPANPQIHVQHAHPAPFAQNQYDGRQGSLDLPMSARGGTPGGDYDSIYDTYAASHGGAASQTNLAVHGAAGDAGYGNFGTGAFAASDTHLVKSDGMYDDDHQAGMNRGMANNNNSPYGFTKPGAGYETVDMGPQSPIISYPPTAPSQLPAPGAPDLPPTAIAMDQGLRSPGGFGSMNMPAAAPWSALGTPGTAIAVNPYAPPSRMNGNAMPLPRFGAGMPGGPALGGYAANRDRLMRKRTVRRIELQNGNLVLDVPVPKSIAKPGQPEEFVKCRYTAVTCKPDEFIRERYATRAWLAGRKTELAVVLTMYNEDEVLFCRTMNSVIKNIAYFSTRNRSKTWGADAWQKIVVVVVSDGRKKANERTLKVLGLMGCYIEGVMKDHVLERETTAHMFEYTTQVIVDAKGNVKVGSCPVQVVFILKEKNAKKLNSHKWFYNAICAQLQPNVTILLDVGTKPTGTSLYELWKAFDKNPMVGGACGEIAVDTGRGCGLLINPLVASQNFEYKISNILDKPLESVFGYISVLPGAFSAYRFKALRGKPLEAYFRGEAMHQPGGATASTFTSNMYLAEDRILCFEITAKSGEAWILKYVKSAKATTDVPDKVPEFISQRRRWLNGSLFAGIHATLHWYRIWTSGHNFFRKLWLTVQVLYNIIQLVFTFTAIANFFLAFFFLVSSATSDPEHDPFGGQGDAILEVMQNVYIALVVVCIVCSLGNRPQGSNFAYTSCLVAFALIMGIAMYCAGWTVYLALDSSGLLAASGWNSENFSKLFATSGFRDIVISLAATYLLWVIASLIHFEPWHLITSFIQYLFLTPFYVTVLAIYSMSNLHDVSWGTKGDNAPSTDLGSASAQKGKDGKAAVEVKIPTTADETEELWAHMQADLAVPKPEEKSHRSADQKASDHAANFRTTFLLWWLGTNALLIIIFTSRWWLNYVRNHVYGGSKGVIVNPYQTVIFWATAGLSAVRAFGSFVYIILYWLGR